MQRILKNDFRIKPFKFQKVQELTDGQKKISTGKSQGVTSLARKCPVTEFGFSDEKQFQIEPFVNKQNNRGYMEKRSAENLQLRLATGTQAPPIVTVWAAATADDRFPLIFIDCGVKINAEYYREKVLRQYCSSAQTNISAADYGHSNRTQHHRTQLVSIKNG